MKKWIAIFVTALIVAFATFMSIKLIKTNTTKRTEQSQNKNETQNISKVKNEKTEENDEAEKTENSCIEIALKDIDGKETNYKFEYKGETFKASFYKGVWHIYDSYKIKNENDITIICQALIDEHPVYGKDRKSYREAKDMTYEWTQHNLAYEMLPDENPWKERAKDVDLDPDDQGKNLIEMFEGKTGRKVSLSDLILKEE